MPPKTVLVTGATGYVGGRLIPRLLEDGYRVKAFGRNLEKMACRAWAANPRVDLVEGDVLDAEALTRAAHGCDAAYWLVHGMIAKKKAYVAADRQAARNMVQAAASGGLQQIIYLGGLGDEAHPRISRHLRSRHEVGHILQAGPVPATVLRAAMILGAGSASFEILRYLVERLPVMITPRWVQTPSQPIAISDVLGYLVDCLGEPGTLGQTFDIGGPEIVTYGQVFDIYAQAAGLPKRRVIPVPFLTPHLSSLWIHLVTPVPASIAVPLTEGLAIPTICRDRRIESLLPRTPLTIRAAIDTALNHLHRDKVATCWSDAGEIRVPEWIDCGDADWAGGTIFTCGYRLGIAASPQAVWQPVTRMGGRQGYYFGNLLWRMRGALDRLAGGVGLRRGRRHAVHLQVGDALDFWRVKEVLPNRRLVLLAEMKLPGEAALEIDLDVISDRVTELRMLSRFFPRGIGGLAYWYALYPFHQWIFAGMLRAIANTIGRPLVGRPRRFTPKIPVSCRLPGAESTNA